MRPVARFEGMTASSRFDVEGVSAIVLPEQHLGPGYVDFNSPRKPAACRPDCRVLEGHSAPTSKMGSFAVCRRDCAIEDEFSSPGDMVKQ